MDVLIYINVAIVLMLVLDGLYVLVKKLQSDSKTGAGKIIDQTGSHDHWKF